MLSTAALADVEFSVSLVGLSCARATCLVHCSHCACESMTASSQSSAEQDWADLVQEEFLGRGNFGCIYLPWQTCSISVAWLSRMLRNFFTHPPSLGIQHALLRIRALHSIYMNSPLGLTLQHSTHCIAILCFTHAQFSPQGGGYELPSEAALHFSHSVPKRFLSVAERFALEPSVGNIIRELEMLN